MTERFSGSDGLGAIFPPIIWSIVALRAMEKHISDTHVAVKAPYLLGSRLCDTEKNQLIARIRQRFGGVSGGNE